MRWPGLLIAACVLLGAPDARADRAVARALVAEGQKLADSGHSELALERYERAMVSEPAYRSSYERALPIWFRLGKWEAAQTRLEELTLRCPECAFAWYALGALYRKRGRFDLAVLAYEAYLAKRPDDADAHFGLAMALGAGRDPRTITALRRYLRMEHREEREAFRTQAARLLANLAESGDTPDSAEQEGGPGARRELLRHARAAGLAGQWFHRAGYLAVAWLMAPAATSDSVRTPE